MIKSSATFENFDIQVTAGKDEKSGLWTMSINITNGGFHFVYAIGQPYMHTVGQWYNLTNGKGAINLRTDNGEVYVFCNHYNNTICFCLTTASTTEDSRMTFTLPCKPMCSCLREVIDQAVLSGWKFAEQ